jgi:hypothetical protein
MRAGRRAWIRWMRCGKSDSAAVAMMAVLFAARPTV